MKVIMKSGKKYWSGKEFSNNPAKIYANFDDAVSALNSYHFFEFDDDRCEYVPCEKKQKIEITHINERQRKRLEFLGKV